MNEIKTRIIRDGDRRVVEIPTDFAVDGEVTIRQEGDVLIIEAVSEVDIRPKSWSEFFDNLEPVDVDWPDLDAGLLPVEDVDLLK